MGHQHQHQHEIPDLKKINTAFILGISLNVLFVIIEVIAGLMNNSLALLTDAGHNVSDIGSLLLSLMAIRLATRKASERFTYGYKKSTILASLLNAVILLAVVLVIIIEAVKRFNRPAEVPGLNIAIVALAGIVINALTAFLFFRDKDKDLNIKGAYLHLFADALVSAAVVVGGLLIHFTGFYVIDPLLSLLVAAVILYSTFGLLRESIKLALDGVPENVDAEGIRKAILNTEGVRSLHHLHIWGLSTTQNAMTVHVVVADGMKPAESAGLKKRIREMAAGLNIGHLTMEIEQESHACEEPGC
ncbi:MAG: cation diffusion facilitator family transporter [Candidatus Neomarinimicrobiota bacterium]|jgi:cobalt-zinc-cadmium efflux system protein|nr:cation diffusion facilitator family transporter [Candidatus Neomarinimicrobiota bacterium]MDX9780088.1 cation diffusion facilitator family transporter [bacterium]